jgi:hypothetical protein
MSTVLAVDVSFGVAMRFEAYAKLGDQYRGERLLLWRVGPASMPPLGVIQIHDETNLSSHALETLDCLVILECVVVPENPERVVR